MGITNLFSADIQPAIIIASVLALGAIVLFFIIFYFVRDEKRLDTAAKKSGKLQPSSKQRTESEIIVPELEDDEAGDSRQHKHWGNLTLAERMATLAPGDKVLYVAAKKQLNRDGLQNFATNICEVYFVGDQPAARLIIYRGLIYLFLNIDPSTLDRELYRHEDVSDKEGYEMLPTMIIIRDSAQIESIPGLVNRLF